ncbi:MAG: DUF177 domain-containing protein [Archangium sp.]|nr:DUF177 domain-containing protein [Archangium sp.]
MRVKIEEIQEPGLTRTAPIERPVLETALADGGDFRLVSSTPLTASFSRISGRVHVKGSFSATVTAPCKRCVDPVELTIPVAFSLRMVREQQKPDDDEEDEPAPAAAPTKRKGRKGHKNHDNGQDELAANFELDEIDAEPFDGKVIDLDPVVREQVVLALPLSVLCRDDCKGLCTTCGAELNEKDCGHGAEKQADPRLAKLKDITLKN